jgi:hypothetical protein
MTEAPKIGDTIWLFDINRRVYAPDKSGGPIWREHWRPVEIVSETSRSYVTKYGERCPKKGRDPNVWVWSQAEIDRAEIVQGSWAIANDVRGCRDADKLLAIRSILDGKE